MGNALTLAEIEALKRFTTPTVSNAIELLGYEANDIRFMSAEIRCFFPDLGPMVGFAATATIVTEKETAKLGHPVPYEHWKAVLQVPAPRVIVVQDLDEPPAVGAWWGEVNSNIHRALGAVGVVTNGGVRDLDEVHAMGFHFFAAAVNVSHCYCHCMDYGRPVKVGGVWIRPGDLIHADQHGVVVVPQDIVKEIPAAVKKLEAAERKIIDLCKSPDFTVEKLRDLFTHHVAGREDSGK
ncbi:MAG: RraA family protein [Candidatus Sumerlaeia bacterium]|nr:RraA family protein [Candidatus Sumerlaeia bacterium]